MCVNVCAILVFKYVTKHTHTPMLCRFIFNPYTYDALRTMLQGKIDPYLECISMRGQLGASVDAESNNISAFFDDDAREGCFKIRPYIETFENQQVSAIAVLERCKSNYQQKQWDSGAFLLYDEARAAENVAMTMPLPVMPIDDPVGSCLLRAERNREGNLACTLDYIKATYPQESSPPVFWRYEKAHFRTKGSQGSDGVDACIVFSGPARRNDSSATTTEFRRCSHDYTDTGCIIPHMVWSSSSQNRVGFFCG
jgi:hypothetical protein